MAGDHAGSDMAPWTSSSRPNGLFLVKWASRDNKDVLFGLASIGAGNDTNDHDNLLVSSLLWDHKFNDRFHTISEMYHVWQRDALTGGAVIEGPPRSFFPSDVPGTLIPRLRYKTTYVEHTLGWAHFFKDWLNVWPEVRLDYTSGAKAIDNGTKRAMFTFSAHLIVRF